MTKTTSLRDPVSVLSAVPDLIEGPPRESIVLLPLSGGSTCGALRVDLPPDHEVDALAATTIGMICRVPDVEAVVTLVFTDAPFADGAGVAHEGVVSAVGDRADACGILVVDELCVAADGWGRYADAVARPLDELGALVERRAELAPPDARLVAEVRAAVEATWRTFAALDRLGGDAAGGESLVSASADVDPHAAVRLEVALDDPTELFETALLWPRDALDPYDVASLLRVLALPDLRDVALTQWTGGREEARAGLDWARRRAGGDNPPHSGPLRLAGEGPRPDRSRVQRARDLMGEISRLAPPAQHAVAHTVTAWLSWALGAASTAADHVGIARRADPAYGLADLLERMLRAGHLPGWVYDRAGASFGPAAVT